MAEHVHPNQKLLAAVSGLRRGGSLILAVIGDAVHTEVVGAGGAASLDDHVGLELDMPDSAGLYVWEGTITVEDGDGAPGDPTAWWKGEWRVASLFDLAAFSVAARGPEPAPAPTDGGRKDFRVYAAGLCATSVCTSLSSEDAAERLNRERPTGISSRWSVAAEPFADGTPNGSACPDAPATHKHYLFTC